MDILTWFVSNFSRFKDILDLEYRVLYFSIMEKTHIEIETNIMGKECVLYMQQYDNLPPRLPLYYPSREGLSGRPPRSFACCPPRLAAPDKFVTITPSLLCLAFLFACGRGQLKLSKPSIFRLVIFECHVSVNMRTSNFEIYSRKSWSFSLDLIP